MITEFYNNVFHSFWTWSGTVILVTATTQGLASFGSAALQAFTERRR